MAIPLKKEHLTFAELVKDFGWTDEDLMHCIWTERIRPAAFLSGRSEPIYWIDTGHSGMAAVPFYCTSQPRCEGFYYLQGIVVEGGKRFRFTLFSKKRDPEKRVYGDATLEKVEQGVEQGFVSWGDVEEWYLIPGDGFDQSWVKENAIFLRDEIERFKAECLQAAATDKPLSTTERETLLIIIAALCKEAKIDYTKASKAAGAILHQADLMGLKIGETTIEEKLKLVPTIVEKRVK